ncbi:MAG: 2-hydroxyhepta-2,4-diene-1,7-dioate isomerase [Betaproteobacteria bacterium]|jgi:5-oxopent-3-ene-1,2,5-tricarboxylate decarboxylase/2-hydroxyhepta-2,4-diene-1,7-dioate isomerase|nr:fumarylacetoacetate hydrolase family protein [Pseudomonadota bacterium]NBO03227.1 2-hydroxyhepta-2,4-diene-1,7-dioate isomerase [Betaproteobacteria bacterium]NBO96629.1 2-hydroxyhepta-2,4-diene-1,7-dioate isomerase [Betaproteobacteria bacterium]NBP34468.1 2-hydroxyhepta-2,4-diene-1,7-dioate isomerase [Betaproteobacteria bacterium]NBP38179.1 2-hydroxyhepta-2,4-diene-1,7-dioate isomerase [Betaproteobacteria bacterium]
MKTARVVYAGAVHEAYPDVCDDNYIVLQNGRRLLQSSVQWLAPFQVGTIIALGLNYADHLKELSQELSIGSKDEPLVFLKTATSLLGHRGETLRPSDASFMHYECELAVVIGKPARRLALDEALDHVLGYTICNDYAVRDYLENWYRPNLRAKNRDQSTVLGPWLVSADEIPDPQGLTLKTYVNRELKQQGRTANMVHSVAEIIHYLSSFMTLRPGDLILTGTPEGVVNVQAGDEVITEIEGIGSLVNHLISQDFMSAAKDR